MSAVIEHTAQARLIARPSACRTLTAALRYDGDDPLAVRLVFSPDTTLDGTEVVWAFARELLQQGLREPAGHGDVQLWPCGSGRAVLELHSPEGVAVLQFHSADLRRFLLRTYDVVPAGREHEQLRLDSALDALLRGV